MNKIDVILIGAGLRGKTYTNFGADYYPDVFRVVAVAEPIESRREYIKKKHNIPENMCFDDYKPLLSLPKIADAAIISTQDKLHFEPAMMAIEKKYNLLLEKPISINPEECVQISDYATEMGVNVIVCHVLRYTPFFRLLKQVIDSDKIGKIMNMVHIENVGNTHYSHSYVRGNWCNSATSSPMILAKCCHDMDIIQWLIGQKCKRVQSFGSLSYFTRENCPDGAPDYCIEGCPHGETCFYNAVTIYQKRRWFVNAATNKFDATDADIEKALRTSPYGKCVFKSDNNVVDRQVVNLEFDGGTTVAFAMSAFNKGGRQLRIMGTKGEITANMSDDHISIFDFFTRTTEIIKIKDAILDETIIGGHGGGDKGIVDAFCNLLLGTYNGKNIANIETSMENHMIAFAAEESRVNGTIVNMDEFVSRYRTI